MNLHMAAAEAALKAGQRDEAIDHLIAALTEDPAQPVQTYGLLLVQLHDADRASEGEAWSAKAAARHARDHGVWNIRGVFLRRLARYEEALAALDKATKINPHHPATWINRGNTFLNMGEGARAEAVFAKLARQDPRNADHQRDLGRALVIQEKYDAAEPRFRQALALKKDFIEPWLDLADLQARQRQYDQAKQTLREGLLLHPGNQKLLEGLVSAMRRSGDAAGVEAFLIDLLPRHDNEAWLHYQLGITTIEKERVRGNVHLRRAFELAPDNIDYRLALIESLARTTDGDEAANLEEAYQLLQEPLAAQQLTTPLGLKIAYELMVRVCDFDGLERLGSFEKLGRKFAAAGLNTIFFHQMPRVRSMLDRLELREQHRISGRAMEALAAKAPIRRSPPRRGGKIRLGFMSSDLKAHVVAYFILPLFEHIDRERFDVFCYSYAQGEEDDVQKFIAHQAHAFRWKPYITSRDAAQMIADDNLDILIELGGSTAMNKLDVMAWRPAPRQASWLGYPHSTGLSTIDYLICDPYNAPTRPDLLIEKPLLLPETWVTLAPQIFSEQFPILPGVPEDLHGQITFGSANNPSKYNRDMLALWAEVMRRVPNSRFMFIRPEGGAPSLRANLLGEFASHGISEDRIFFENIRGQHRVFMNFVDISLDTGPFTGGTTTVDTLWMGVPVVSLVGDAFFERLSYSNLVNSGLEDLGTPDPAAFVDIAVGLAEDKERRVEIRHTLRERIKTGPLGRSQDFARNFYDTIARVVAETPGDQVGLAAS